MANWRSIPVAEKTDADYWEVLKSKCILMPSGCLEWQGFRRPPPRHYGDMSYRCKNWRTHRITWVIHFGPIPKGMVVMHTCDNPPCCNPEHLKLGTHLENMADCRAKDRYYYANLTHCKRGHPFDAENTYIIKTPGEWQGLRACKACQRGKGRIKAGWPEDLAYSLPAQQFGYRPQIVRSQKST